MFYQGICQSKEQTWKLFLQLWANLAFQLRPSCFWSDVPEIWTPKLGIFCTKFIMGAWKVMSIFFVILPAKTCWNDPLWFYLEVVRHHYWPHLATSSQARHVLNLRCSKLIYRQVRLIPWLPILQWQQQGLWIQEGFPLDRGQNYKLWNKPQNTVDKICMNKMENGKIFNYF